MSVTAPAADMTGRVLGGKYLLGEALGTGGYGTVYAAMQRDLGRPCAVKVLDGRVSDHDVARFEREARAAAGLGHPHIVQVTDFSARPGEPPFIVMEMLSGETLGSLMKRNGRVPAPRVAAIAQQILAALDAAHRAGIVHRDVKPANVFLVANTGVDDFVKLLDFGIAKVGGDATALTQSGAMLGSPAYMAPEQVRGGAVDARTDLYALGATMYHALSGRYPFDAPTVHALLYAIAESWPTGLASVDASIDPRLVGIVERAMHKDPAARFQSAAEMRAALAPFASGAAATVSYVPPPDLHTPMQMPALSPAPAPAPAPGANSNVGLILGIIGGLFLLLLLAGGAGIFFYLRTAEAEPKSTTIAQPSAAPASPASPSPAVSTTTSASTSAPAKKSSPSPSPPPSPAPSPSPSRAPSSSAAPPPAPAFGGTNPRYSGGTYRKPIKSAAVRPAIDAALPAIKQCFVATEFDAPDHRSTDWTIAVDATGAVTSVTRKDIRNAHPKLDSCVTTALRAMKVPPVEGAGSFDLSLYAPAKGDF